MKNIYTSTTIVILILFISLGNELKAQVKIGDNPATINNSSLLEMESTDKGMLISRMTAAQRTSIVSPATGLLVFQTDTTSGFYFYNGTVWEILLADTAKTNIGGRHLNIIGKGSGSTKTTTAAFDNTVAEQFSMNDELYFDISHMYDYVGGDMPVYFDFIPMGTETNKTVRWNLFYKIYTAGGIVSGTTGTLDSGDITLNTTQYQEQDVLFTIPAAALIGAEAVHFKIKRVAIGAGTNPGTDPAGLHCNVRYTARR